MRANLLLDERIDVADTMFVEMVIWKVPQPVIGCDHFFKYRLAFIVENKCVLRHDNEAGKGDHKHWGFKEIPYVFSNLDSLIDAFYDDVVLWRSKRWMIGKEQ